jgi:glycosyltransferase involved in cell wall biosynthesis
MSDNLHILLITQYFPPDLGGVATRTNNLVKGLTLNNCTVTVITAFPHYPHGKIPPQYRLIPIKVEQMGKIRVIRTYILPMKSEGFFKRLLLMGSFAVSSLFALPWTGRTDAVWGTSWIPGIFYSKVKRVPLILDVCDLTIEDLPLLKLADAHSLLLKVASAVYRILYVKGDAVAPISSGYVDTIEKKYCVKRTKIHVVENGVDITEFKVSPAKRTTQKFTVTYAGVLGVGYDFEQIFEAAQILQKDGLAVEFILHGTGECLESIRNRLRELNLTNVRLSDRLFESRREVAAFLGEADALILPLKDYGGPYPGIPSKLYEYQAVGKPVICCAAGEPAKYIANSNSGVVVKPEDAEALATAVKQLHSNPELAKAMGNNGRRYVEQNVAIDALGAKVKNLFLTLRKR